MPMTNDDITQAQAKKISATVGPMLRYFRRLRERMELRRFPESDRYYQSVCRAYDATHEVHALHEL
jgi:hypothetical protein